MQTRRRRRRDRREATEFLEERLLLTGRVRVDLVGNDLRIAGDGGDNHVVVDLDAETREAFVAGQNGTTVWFSRDFDRFKGPGNRRLDDVRVFMRGGQDTVEVRGGTESGIDDLTVFLGPGDDSLTVTGDGGATIGGRLSVRAGGGDDQVRIQHVQISDDLIVATSVGDDTIEIVDVGIGDRSTLRTLSGRDTVVTSDTTFGDRLLISLGAHDDVLSVAGGVGEKAIAADDVRVFGATGDDQIHLSGMDVRDDLSVFTSLGDDVVTASGLAVHGRARLSTSAGSDTVLVSQAEFGGDLVTMTGTGADFIGVTRSEFMDRVYADVGPGADLAIVTETPLAGVRRAETVTDDPEAASAETAAVVRMAKETLSGLANDVERSAADAFQNHLASLAADYGARLIELGLDPVTQLVTVSDPTPTVSVLWDQAAQDAVINTGPGPTIGSRAFALVHTAMFDAWSAYDAAAASTVLDDTLQRPAEENTRANKIEAMSFAAYRVLDDLFASESSIFDDLMADLGFDPTNTSTDTTTPAGIGNTFAAELLSRRHADGSNQSGDDPSGTAGVPYSDTSSYAPVNSPETRAELDRWTPERVPIDAAAGEQDHIQEFLTPHWGQVTPFALTSGDQFRPDAPEPFLLVDGVLDFDAQTITLSDGTVEPINADLVGTVINPEFILQAEHVVDLSANLTDEQKLIAEFWEDGGGTSFPPGTWMTFGQFVSARDNHSLDQDAQLFFALGNAVFDAGIATWEAKAHFDYARPVRAIRDLGTLDLIGEFDAARGESVIDAWVPNQGTQTIPATEFLTYQTPGSDPSPPFAEYTSGHSAFSAAAAEILSRFTGSDSFDASVTFDTGESRFEPGVTPQQPVTLQWDTFSAAADEAGISRLYGGIHFTDGDINGRGLGRSVGEAVWDRVEFFVSGAQG